MSVYFEDWIKILYLACSHPRWYQSTKKEKCDPRQIATDPSASTTPVGNVMERLINARITWFLINLENRKGQDQQHQSRKEIFRDGVPQGCVLWPTVFIIFMNDLLNGIPGTWCFVRSNVVLIRTTVPDRLKFCLGICFEDCTMCFAEWLKIVYVSCSHLHFSLSSWTTFWMESRHLSMVLCTQMT